MKERTYEVQLEDLYNTFRALVRESTPAKAKKRATESLVKMLAGGETEEEQKEFRDSLTATARCRREITLNRRRIRWLT